MRKGFAFLLQTILFLIVGAGVIYFADSPSYNYFPEDQAMIKISFKHTGQRLEDCRRLTPEEIAKLPPNERKPMDCSRERSPLVVKVVIDGTELYNEELLPSGLFGDGPAKVYSVYQVGTGSHDLEVYLRDSERQEGFDYQLVETVTLDAGEILVIDFVPEGGGLVIG